MKRSTEPWTKQIVAISMLVCALASTKGFALGGDPEVELVLAQSPTGAGKVTPNTGVHRFMTNATISITAIPLAGYRFSHWLGDVTDPSTNTTQIHLNNSKAVMAVYKPIAGYSTENSLHPDEFAKGGGIGVGNVIPTRADFFTSGFSAPGGSVRPRGIRPASKSDTVPAPVPEPATFLLLGIGSIAFVRSAKHRKGRSS